MSFAFHSDVYDHPVFGSLSLEAFGLWALAGTWTSGHHSPGFVPDHAVSQLVGSSDHASEVAAELVNAGAWSRIEGGYKMEYGPSADFPLPVWRYDDKPPANGRLFEILPDPDR